ncbi:MAG: NifU family protein [Bacilli bacterium]
MPDSGFEDFKILEKANRYISFLNEFLRKEGSELKIKDCKSGVLYLTMTGACIGCSLAGNDFEQFKNDLMAEDSQIKDVVFYDSSENIVG